MKQERHRWRSPALGREMELQVVGHAGARVFVFPTTLGSLTEWTDRWMHRWGVLGEHLDRGWIQLYCLHHVHEESWYAPDHVHPGHRAWRHLQYDRGEFRRLPRPLFRAPQSAQRESHHRPLGHVRHQAPDGRLLRCQRLRM